MSESSVHKRCSGVELGYLNQLFIYKYTLLLMDTHYQALILLNIDWITQAALPNISVSVNK